MQAIHKLGRFLTLHCLMPVIILSGIMSATAAFGEQPTAQWAVSAGYPGTPSRVVADDLGNVYVTGATYSSDSNVSSSAADMLTVKYDAQGVKLWEVRYNGPNNGADAGYNLVVDQSGSVFVVGASYNGVASNTNAIIAKYGADGQELWVRRYSENSDRGSSCGLLALDAAGNLYVGLTSIYDNPAYVGLSGIDMVVMKYDTDGTKVWKQWLDSPIEGDDAPSRIIVKNNYVYLAGMFDGGDHGWSANLRNYAVFKFALDGTPVWTARYDGGNQDIPTDCRVDDNDNVYVTGYSDRLQTGYDDSASYLYDYATVKFNASGVMQWVARYRGTADGQNYATAMELDTEGNVYVTGYGAGAGTGIDIATIKYRASDGAELWVDRYNGTANGNENSGTVSIDAHGDVYVSGTSLNAGTGKDYTLIKYSPEGIRQWVELYNGAANGDDQLTSMALDAQRNIYLTGASTDAGGIPQFLTSKYVQEAMLGVTASLASGSFATAQTVTLAADEPATIYYTIDGSDPLTSPTVLIYAGPITINVSTTLKFYARTEAGISSLVKTKAYVIDAIGPVTTVSPAAGTYVTPQTVTLTANEPSTIFYTTDGSIPTSASAIYSGPISVSTTTTLNFFSRDRAGNSEQQRSSTFTISFDVLDDFETGNLTRLPWQSGGNGNWGVIASEGHNSTYGAQAAGISHNQSSYLQFSKTLTNPGSISFWYKVSSEGGWDYLRFKIDGVEQGGWSGEVGWTQAFYQVSKGTHTFTWEYSKDVSASYGRDTAWIDDVSFVDTSAPVTTANPGGGTYEAPITVTLTVNEQATIHYTTNGSNPTIGSPVYSGPITIAGSRTLKFFAVDEAGNRETVKTLTYLIGPAPTVISYQPLMGSIVPANSTAQATFSDEMTPATITTDNFSLSRSIGIKAIDAGSFHTLVLKNDSTVSGWGRNYEGEITVPTGLTGVIAITAGSYSGVALKNDGTVVAWGGSGSEQGAVPVDLSGVIAIAAGGAHTLALKNDGTVVAWGTSSYYYYGQTTVPVGLSGVTAIAAGGNQSLALKNDGTVVAWGENSAALPVGLSGVIAIAAGPNHAVALKNDGTVVAWGGNYYGQCAVPADLAGVTAIAAGYGHTVALKNDGTLVAWGTDVDNHGVQRGPMTVPAGLSGVTAITAGNYHTVALKMDGTVVAWGSIEDGQLPVPAEFGALGNVVNGTISYSPATRTATLTPSQPLVSDTTYYATVTAVRSQSGVMQVVPARWSFRTEDRTPPITTASPVSGTFAPPMSVTLTTNESATIFYTIDGTDPSTNSTVYNGPITISTPTTLKVFAVDALGNIGEVKTEQYAFWDLANIDQWQGIGPMSMIHTIAISPTYSMDNTLFTAACDMPTSNDTGVFKSTNSGTSWSHADSGIFDVMGVDFLAISPAYAADQTIFAGSIFGAPGVYKSTNGGANWNPSSNGLPGNDNISGLVISPDFQNDHTLYVITAPYGGPRTVYKSSDGGMFWDLQNNGILGLGVTTLQFSPNYATDQTIFAGTPGSGVYISIDRGVNWSPANNGIGTIGISKIAVSPGYAVDHTIFAGNFGSGVYKTTDAGANWYMVNYGITNLNITALAISPNYLNEQVVYAGTDNGLFKSTNGGASWGGDNDVLTAKKIVSLIFSPGYAADRTVFAGTDNGGVFKISRSLTGPAISISPARADFGLVSPMISNSKSITIRNIGNMPLNIGSIGIVNNDSNSFGFYAGYCPSSLMPSTACDLYVNFMPAVLGVNGAELQISSNDEVSPMITVPLSGTAVLPITTASPVGGTYQAPQTVSLNTNVTATVYYTIDGTDPQTSATSQYYTGPITVSGNTTLKFYSVDVVGNSENVKTEIYAIDGWFVHGVNPADSSSIDWQVAQQGPAALPGSYLQIGGTLYFVYQGEAGSWNGLGFNSVKLQQCDQSTRQLLTTSWTFQNCNYDDNFNWVCIPFTTTMPLFANMTGQEGAVIVNPDPPITIASPAGGMYIDPQIVTLAATKPATIYYTVNGVDPTTDSPVYSEPIHLDTMTTLKFFARDKDGVSETSVKTEVYTIGKFDQSLSFADLPAMTYGDSSFTLSATATSGLPVSYTSSNPSVATVSGNSVTIVGAGVATITARQEGDATYSGAKPIAQLLTVNKANATLALGNLIATYDGSPKAASVLMNPAGLAHSLTYNGVAIAPTAAGSYNVLCTINDANFQGSATGILVINQVATSITLNTITPAFSTYGEQVTINATVSPATAGGKVQFGNGQGWSQLIDVVNGSAQLTTAAIPAGINTITAQYQGDGNYLASTSTGITLPVNKAAQTITFLPLANKTVIDAPFTLVAVASSGLPITYTSTNPAVATVSGNIITIVGLGTTTIIAGQWGDGNYNSASTETQTLTITKATATITFSNLNPVYDGTPKTVTVTTNPAGLALAITYNGSPTAPTAAGSYPVAATINDATYQGSATDTLIISKAGQTISCAELPIKTYGDPALVLGCTASSGLPVTYTSSTPAVATISGNTITLVGAGTTSIIVSQDGNENYSTALALTQALTVNKATATVTLGNLTAIYNGTPKAATAITTPTGLTVVFTYNDLAVAPNAAGSYTVVGTINDANYQGSAAGTLTIAPATTTVSITSATPNPSTFGQAVTVTAVVTPAGGSGKVQFSNDQGWIQQVDVNAGNGGAAVTISTLQAGGNTIKAQYLGDSNHVQSPLSAGVTQIVNKANQTISFAPLPNKMAGDPDFALSANASSGLPVSFSSSNTAVVSVSGTTVTVVGPGTATIIASQWGDSNYNSASAVSQAITVISAQQGIKLNDGGSDIYVTTLTAAYNSITSGSNASIQLPITTLTDTLVFDKNYQLTLLGGYDALLGTYSGVTTIQGSITIQGGSVIFDGVCIM